MGRQDVFSIIMAAGKGHRMESPGHNKVCLEVGGVPAIVRALDTYEACGIKHHIVVVGELAEQVLTTVGERYPNCTYAYQPVPLGTGNAVKVGARGLQDAGYQEAVFVTAGDKVIEARVVRDLIEHFREGAYDLVLVAGPSCSYPTSGRVLLDDAGAPVAIIEVSEIKLSRAIQEMMAALGEAAAIPGSALLEIARRHFPNEKKAKVALGRLWHALQEQEQLSAAKLRQLLEPLRQTTTVPSWSGGAVKTIPASAVESMTSLANICAYIYRAPALYHSLSQLTRDNAQREEFLTDTIKVLAAERRADGSPRYRLGVLEIGDPTEVMGFNTPAELAEVRRVVEAKTRATAAQVKEKPRRLRTVSQWHRMLTADDPAMHRFMDEVYGSDRDLHEAKRQEYLKALDLYRSRLGTDDEVMIVRTPGRLNLMGRHTDHRGSRTNMIAISEEIVMVVCPRDDDQLHLHNTADHLFTHTAFSIAEEIRELDWSDWLTTIRSPRTMAMVSNGHWANYVRAPAFRLQREFPDLALKGANIVTHGTIPIGSGLSSSSAMVVGAAETLIAVNDLPVRPRAMVDLCGEGEWFVGTRGGSSDHAAIKFARPGQVAHVAFFPFEVREFVPFFEDHSLIVCNSGIQAKKSEGARETYNRRVLGYTLGEIIFKHLHPEFAAAVEHLRDLTCENLGVTLPRMYDLLRELPVRITEQEFRRCYGPLSEEEEDRLGGIFSAILDRDSPHEVRSLVIYGLAECARSKLCPHLLRNGEADTLGLWWNLSHDGDRVVKHDAAWVAHPYRAEVSDNYLKDLVADLKSCHPQRRHNAQMHLQRGAYACSTPEIDRIVDLALRQPGVKGAQISGAGLGGCVMILADNQDRDQVVQTLRGDDLETAVYAPVAGSGLVEV